MTIVNALPPNGVDDTEALQMAIDLATALGEIERLRAELAALTVMEDAVAAESEYQLDPQRAPLTPYGIALVQATIERCAEVAERQQGLIAKDIAADIRTLKDRP